MARIRQRTPTALLKTAIQSPIADAIQKELAELAATTPFTIGTISAIQRLAQHGRELLSSQAELNMILAHPGRIGNAGSLVDTAQLPFDDGFVDDYISLSNPLPLSPSPPIENFGTKAMREMVSAIPKALNRKPSLVELVRALGEARKLGLDDVAEHLTKEIKNEMVHPELERGLSVGAKRGDNQPGDPGPNGAGESDPA